MTTDTPIPGEGLLYAIEGDGLRRITLSVRECLILSGALDFHALMAPGRRLTAHLYDGRWEHTPRTTDDSTFDGLHRRNRTRIGSLVFTSLVPIEDRSHTSAEVPADALIERDVRHLHISSDDVLAFDPPRDISPDPVRRALRAIRARTPLLYDELRDIELLRHRHAIRRPARRRDYAHEFDSGGIHAEAEVVPGQRSPAGAPRAVIIGMHWFELGGAETWALTTVKLVRELGFIPIVLTNRDSHQPLLARPELEGALIVPFSEPTVRSQTPGVEQLLRAILRTFDIRGVVVHHNQWLYDRLPWLRRSRPEMPIVDSTHIVEYRGGGFPVSSALIESSLTAHHVISPQLQRWMTAVQGIDPRKVVMAPLGGLTVQSRNGEWRPRSGGERLAVAFIGRMSRQKAPEVFVEIVHRLRDDANLRFILHGDGDMSSWVDDIIRAEDLGDRIERRSSAIPVSATLDEAHLLVIPSHNEGLTLTTLEAVAHGVPVISTDVGAQSDIVPPWAMVPRNVHRAVRGLAACIRMLAGDEAARHRLWCEEKEAEVRLLTHPTATQWFTEEVRGW